MALVHSRIRRVIFAAPIAEGALFTQLHIHTIESLNHRYRAFLLKPETDPSASSRDITDVSTSESAAALELETQSPDLSLVIDHVKRIHFQIGRK